MRWSAISGVEGRVGRLWGVDGAAKEGRRPREDTDRFGNRDGEGGSKRG